MSAATQQQEQPTTTTTQTAAAADVEPQLCSICLEPIGVEQEPVTLSCSHVFHGRCIVESFRYSPRCPMCRDSPQEQRYREQIQQYRVLCRKKRQVIGSDALVSVNLMRDKFRARRRVVLARLREEMRLHGDPYRLMCRLQRESLRLQSQIRWCDSRVHCELLKNHVPLTLRRPVHPVVQSAAASLR
jgi:hypothetical protein